MGFLRVGSNFHHGCAARPAHGARCVPICLIRCTALGSSVKSIVIGERSQAILGVAHGQSVLVCVLVKVGERGVMTRYFLQQILLGKNRGRVGVCGTLRRGVLLLLLLLLLIGLHQGRHDRARHGTPEIARLMRRIRHWLSRSSSRLRDRRRRGGGGGGGSIHSRVRDTRGNGGPASSLLICRRSLHDGIHS